MKITILGGGGFLGRRIATRLAKTGTLGGRSIAGLTLFDLHQPPPLDVLGPVDEIVPGVRAAPMDDDRVHLLCHSHGALYRTRDGYCVSGPCIGQSLVALEVAEEPEKGAITLILPIEE